MMRTPRRSATALALLAGMLLGSGVLPFGAAQTSAATATTPIKHIIFVVMENRTFDNVLGYQCYLRSQGQAAGSACDGATTGLTSANVSVPLVAEPDVRPDINHSHESQVKAINGGLMNKFDQVLGCNSVTNNCLSQFKGTVGSSVPNVWNYASTYAISDQTFEPFTSSSWGAHLEVAAGTIEQWRGNNPRGGTAPPGTMGYNGKGWGCNSLKDAPWDTSPTTYVPEASCIPDQSGLGPYKPTLATYTPTIMDRMDSAGLSWRIYVQSLNSAWSICATFYDCYAKESVNKVHVKSPASLTADSVNGTLPSFAFVIPKNFNSMHPSFSAAAGDNWLASVVNPLLTGPEANSTAIFVTWDDCACMYDHVNPLQYNSLWGPRLPMLIISPYAKAGYVSHTPTTFAGVLAYAEHTFGLAPLADQDGAAYNNADTGAWYNTAFDYLQTPTPPPAIVTTRIPNRDLKKIKSLVHHRWS